MSILDTHTRPQLVKLIEDKGLTLHPNLDKNLTQINNNNDLVNLAYGDKILLCGIMYAMLKNRSNSCD
jgi:hypothetical protein